MGFNSLPVLIVLILKINSKFNPSYFVVFESNSNQVRSWRMIIMIMMMIIMMTLMTILADFLIMIIIMMMIMMIMIMMMTIVAGSRGISDVLITGPSVLENGRQQWVDLACSFTFTSAEYKQLDIKWYFDNEVSQSAALGNWGYSDNLPQRQLEMLPGV